MTRNQVLMSTAEQCRQWRCVRRIAVHRRYLAEGVDEALAAEYRRQIAEDEAELDRIAPSWRAN